MKAPHRTPKFSLLLYLQMVMKSHVFLLSPVSYHTSENNFGKCYPAECFKEGGHSKLVK
jgi:hypothetical protein